ncbi:MAG: hypothetical protein ACI3XT_01385 [Butyricicoccaceae bacterium]
MQRFKRLFHRLLFPHPAVLCAGVLTASALLFYVFAYGKENTPIAYLAYPWSAYVLTAVCAWTAKNADAAVQKLQAKLNSIPLVHRYMTDVSFKMHASLCLSLGFNLLYAGLKFIYGVRLRSVWFGTLAVYYILLALMRFLLLHHVSRDGFGRALASELRHYRMCGLVLLLMNIALSGVVILVVLENAGFVYAGHLIYIMAIYAFYNIISAAVNVVRCRRFRSPVMSAAKVINFVAALVSMLSLETAMLDQFVSESDPAAFRQMMTAATGGCVCLLVFLTAVFMVVHATRQLRVLRQADPQAAGNGR